MEYISTRGAPGVDFATALMHGLAPDGGLYVPYAWSKLKPVRADQTYLETAYAVLQPLFADSLDATTVRTLLENTYMPRTNGFLDPRVTPLVALDDRLSVLELFHGPTLAFKDVALQLLGRLFSNHLSHTREKITILGATSGDTGSAAIEGCRHAEGVRIFILYPHGRPSEVQRRQMTTVDSPNVHAIAVDGNFDDCQAIVKTLFNDPDFREKRNLSAVNSINWARIAAQIVYYVHTAYSFDAPVNFVVPTGNFGNVFAAYAAKQMGAPIARLIVASNRNDILTRFLASGTMQTHPVEPSLSPSMDIQVSSNFERLLFDLLGRDPLRLRDTMKDFAATGRFTLPSSVMDEVHATFTGISCTDEQTLASIAKTNTDYGYLTDPHTAVGFHAYDHLKHELEGPVVTLACAHPAKFPAPVEHATGQYPALPAMLADLMDRPEKITRLPADAGAVRAFIENHPA